MYVALYPVPIYAESAVEALRARRTNRTSVSHYVSALPSIPTRRERDHVMKGRLLIGRACPWLLPHCQLMGQSAWELAAGDASAETAAAGSFIRTGSRPSVAP